jgi:hypothetical protein
MLPGDAKKGFCCLGTSQQKRQRGCVRQSLYPRRAEKKQQGRKPLLHGPKWLLGYLHHLSNASF